MTGFRVLRIFAILAGLLGAFRAEAGQSLSIEGETWSMTARAGHVEVYRRPKLREATGGDEAFASGMSRAIERASELLETAPTTLRFLFIDSAYPRLPKSPIKFFGFVDYDLNARYGEDFILLDPSFGLGPNAIHAGIHDYQHIVSRRVRPDEPRWLQEGLSELLAWRVTGILPDLSIAAFLGEPSPLALAKTEISELGMADYGQSYLFLRFLWERFTGDRIFTDRAGGWPGGLGLGELYRRFAVSLAVPHLVDSGEYGWKDRVFTRPPSGPPRASIPPFSFALADVGIAMLQRGRLEVDAPAPLVSYLIELGGGEARIRTLADVARDRGYSPGRRLSLLVINPTAEKLEYALK
jgi:hypothetical protein